MSNCFPKMMKKMKSIKNLRGYQFLMDAFFSASDKPFLRDQSKKPKTICDFDGYLRVYLKKKKSKK